MSAKDEKITELLCNSCANDIFWCRKCQRKKELKKMIAAAQLEAVESFWQEIRPPMPHAQIDRIITVCVYTHTVFKAIEQLRKAAKGE